MIVKSTWIPTWHSNGLCFVVTNYFLKRPLGGRPNIKPWDHGIPNAHNHWFIVCYHVRGPTRIGIHRKCIWLRAWSHMASHYTWGSVTTLHDFGGVLACLGSCVNFTHEPRAVTMELWKPKRSDQRSSQSHAVWSRILKCSVMPYVTMPSTKCYFNAFLIVQVLTHYRIQ